MNITMNKHDISLQFNAHILNLKISTKLTKLCIPLRSSHPSNSVTLMTLLGQRWYPSNCSPSITYPPATFCSEAPTFHSLPSCPKYHQEASCPKQHQQGIRQCLVYPTSGRRNFMEEQASMNTSNLVWQRKSRVSRKNWNRNQTNLIQKSETYQSTAALVISHSYIVVAPWNPAWCLHITLTSKAPSRSRRTVACTQRRTQTTVASP